MELLEKYDWPGNVRELQSTIHEALIVSAGPTILPDFLPPTVRWPPRLRRNKRQGCRRVAAIGGRISMAGWLRAKPISTAGRWSTSTD